MEDEFNALDILRRERSRRYWAISLYVILMIGVFAVLPFVLVKSDKKELVPSMSLYYPSPGSEPTSLRDFQVLYEPDDWHEDFGPVVWWRYPVEEPPYVGCPLSDDWVDGYYTHWSKLLVPPSPDEYNAEVADIARSWSEHVRENGR